MPIPQIQTLLQLAKQLLVDTKQLTPTVAKMVNDVRALAHTVGELTPEDEADFHLLADRFKGYIVKGTLSPLPTEGLDGKPLPPLPPVVQPVPSPAAASTIPDKAPEQPPAAPEAPAEGGNTPPAPENAPSEAPASAETPSGPSETLAAPGPDGAATPPANAPAA